MPRLLLPAVLPGMLLLFSAHGCADALQVGGGKPVAYTCSPGATVVARYYHLSDESLSFVRLEVGRDTHTLPQVVSASGARYTDEREIVWWIKGEGAQLQTRAPDGSWRAASTCGTADSR